MARWPALLPMPVLMPILVIRQPHTLFIGEDGIDVMVSTRLQDSQLAFGFAERLGQSDRVAGVVLCGSAQIVQSVTRLMDGF